MALLSFRIETQRAPRLAEAESVPPIMVIAGPNGVGKSTLLYAIKNSGTFDPDTRILYQGPHRVLRRTTVRRSWLGGQFRMFQDLLSRGEVDGYEGLSFGNTSRSPENVDEAGSTIKHTLGKIENRYQSTLTATVHRLKARGGPTDLSGLPDIYEPLRRLTEFLLPHLRFDRIDFTNEDDIKCYWKRSDASGSTDVDIDELSSGEKAIIVLFLPLLEDQIQVQRDALATFGDTVEEVEATKKGVVVLIDEPELHLHPDLQAKILIYMRNISQETNTQFVITTHSPTILDQAFENELYVLSEATLGVVENQLRKVATNAERLEALKQLAGSAYFLTTGRVLVCIEGEPDVDPEKPTDARLLGILYPRAAAVTLVPTTGKSNIITTVQRLREHVPEETFRIRVRGLLDADQSDGTIPGIETLPVCMIENLILDSQSLFDHLASVGVTSLPDAAAVEAELRDIARGQRDKEIDLRLQRRLKRVMVRIGGASIEAVKAKHAEMMEQVGSMLPDDAALVVLVAEATASVDAILSAGSELDHFRGKPILEAFHTRHLVPRSLGYNAMCIDVAKRVSTRGTVAPLLDPIFERLMTV